MDPFSIVASIIGLATAVGGIVSSVKNRKEQKDTTLDMFDKETEVNRENWQMQNDYNANQLVRNVNDAKQAGLNPLSVLNSPSYSAGAIHSASATPYPSADTSLLTSILPFASSLMSQSLESQKVEKDNEVKNAEIDKIVAETEGIRQRNSNQASKNKAIVQQLKEKGIDIPEIGATGFLDGMETADEVFTKFSDRKLRRVVNDNLIKIEDLKSSPEYLEKMQRGMYAELDKKVVDLDTSRELLKKAKLDNKKAVQEIEINNVRYQVIQTELAEKLFNLHVVLPKQAQALDLANDNARADFEKKYLDANYMLLQIDQKTWSNAREKAYNPLYWEDKLNEAFANGDYVDYGAYWFNFLVTGTIDAFRQGVGSILH